MASRLLRVAEQPLVAKLRGHSLMWDQPAGSFIGLSTCNRLHNVQVILDVIQRAVVWKSSEQCPDLFLGCHMRSESPFALFTIERSSCAHPNVVIEPQQDSEGEARPANARRDARLSPRSESN